MVVSVDGNVRTERLPGKVDAGKRQTGPQPSVWTPLRLGKLLCYTRHLEHQVQGVMVLECTSAGWGLYKLLVGRGAALFDSSRAVCFRYPGTLGLEDAIATGSSCWDVVCRRVHVMRQVVMPGPMAKSVHRLFFDPAEYTWVHFRIISTFSEVCLFSISGLSRTSKKPSATLLERHQSIYPLGLRGLKPRKTGRASSLLSHPHVSTRHRRRAVAGSLPLR